MADSKGASAGGGGGEGDGSGERECRICLLSEPADSLIAPCLCKGSAKWIHRQCLDHWRATKRGQAFTHCGTCHFKYKLRALPADDDARQRASLWRYRLFVSRDIGAGVLALVAVVLATAHALQWAHLGPYFDHLFGGTADDEQIARFRRDDDLTGGFATDTAARAAAGRVHDAAATAGAGGPYDPFSFGGYVFLAVVLLLMALGVVGLAAWALGYDIGVSEGLEWWRRTCLCDCHGGQCRCGGGACNCNGCVGGGGGGGCLAFVAVLLVIAGLIVAVGVGAALVNRTVRRHSQFLWLREETQRYVVEDLNGREHLIERF